MCRSVCQAVKDACGSMILNAMPSTPRRASSATSMWTLRGPPARRRLELRHLQPAGYSTATAASAVAAATVAAAAAAHPPAAPFGAPQHPPPPPLSPPQPPAPPPSTPPQVPPPPSPPPPRPPPPCCHRRHCRRPSRRRRRCRRRRRRHSQPHRRRSELSSGSPCPPVWSASCSASLSLVSLLCSAAATACCRRLRWAKLEYVDRRAAGAVDTADRSQSQYPY